jgi:hypothetical protein
MISALALTLAMMAQDGGFPTDRETLSQYMVQSCIVQQVANQGGAPADYVASCSCLDEEIGSNTSDLVYRAIALGSQGAIGEDAQVEDSAAALSEAERLIATAPEAERLALPGILQSGLMACMADMPADNSAQGGE